MSFSMGAMAQTETTANDVVPDYDAGFRYGTNLGYLGNGWTDQMLSNYASGNEEEGIDGVGLNSLRLSLPEYFLEKWGYGIRTNAFDHYVSNGMSDLTVFAGDPSDDHLLDEEFCSGKQSLVFDNLYEPIWDNGENDTPVNDDNYMALYMYNMAINYTDNVRFWEIWNEPDYNNTDIGWKGTEYDDNWWIRDPDPCELVNLLAPVEYYIRMLRIAYEVIKYVDSDDYVCIGGIGYESFLDAVLRNTDNPNDGSTTTKYPLKGGAYFDCLSYHIYPMYGMSEYVDGDWVYHRNSDEAITEMVEAGTSKIDLMATYGYDGETYPEKRVIITETNIPAVAFDEYIGSDEAQRNYLTKAAVIGPKYGIDQIHTFLLYEGQLRSEVSGPYGAMGFYKIGEKNDSTYISDINSAGIGVQNVMNLLDGYSYSATATKSLDLPDEVEGAAYAQGSDLKFVLWAKTTKDKDESAEATYTFPEGWEIKSMKVYDWDYTNGGSMHALSGDEVVLSGAPVTIEVSTDRILGLEEEEVNPDIYLSVESNTWMLNSTDEVISLRLYDMNGREYPIVSENLNKQSVMNKYALQFNNVSGLYILDVETYSDHWSQKIFIK